ncbi:MULTISPECIES: DUF4112 domain-containing protein [unclassified Tolypothrix]|uniref:DUF4112 domain-containing protein n=1 Tax=unclassified Tolypothrix TaxID=2649714 RepID=UPI0005EAB391|nr:MULTISPECIES: DUF4112 domain-containing protein [unclassified Tolypothrix]BAY91636.1 hypothetical protein NIES3275_36600 [Microchaete diplosiphon NIES-3275]EKF05254.1 hypothetical protein FDUTEX481_01425 [Tolypothrix sp. PCC 7601]MBE9083294.1 DUF4112 domain-containing protein [Tolypothrix sp. LEGE 11397]QIR37609.1 DUF4112 domain-containing protein [Tolypothrix sp. PCC 7910]UYD25655.1 DUF4112 domain-containing protein [Tolypothrix sp. PCC 7712]
MPDSPSRYPIIEPDAKAPRVRRLRQLSRILDNAITIPGTQVGVGIDPILGLLPVGGDFLGVMLSCYIVVEAARLGVPRATIGRMVFNIIVDGLVGSFPMLGDLFDFAWKANSMNIQLLEDNLKFSSQTQKADRLFIFALVAGLLVIAIVLVVLPVILIRLLWQAITGG